MGKFIKLFRTLSAIGSSALICILLSLLATPTVIAAATDSSTPLVAPPRNIDDITAILDEQARDNPKIIAAARKIVASEPKSKSRRKLIKFFFKFG